MTLFFEAEFIADTGYGAMRRSKDDQGRLVIVEATTEAIQDHGWDEICGVASKKYDNGQVEIIGGTSRVRVTSADL